MNGRARILNRMNLDFLWLRYGKRGPTRHWTCPVYLSRAIGNVLVCILYMSIAIQCPRLAVHMRSRGVIMQF